jgi:sugar O-acyltransferase (sialic acid O-acetyltransferase NeuD family)
MLKGKLILIGGGGHCRSCIDVIEAEGMWAIAGVLDSGLRIGERVFDYPVVGTDEDIPRLAGESRQFLVTLGQIKSADRRMALYARVRAAQGKLPVIVSPHAHVSPRASVGQGSIVMHGALVNAGARVGENVILNSMALIEHDAEVGDHCHISAGARINGGANVAARSFVGSGAVVFHGARMPESTQVPAGSVFRA